MKQLPPVYLCELVLIADWMYKLSSSDAPSDERVDFVEENPQLFILWTEVPDCRI